MNSYLRPAFSLLVLFSILLGIGYPLAITGIAAAAFPAQAGGSLVAVNGVVVGSKLIGQDFHSDRYFWPRPSATSDKPYNAASSSGTNLGPTSAKLRDAVDAETKRLQAAGVASPVPVDAVTSSGSGLDPHISPVYAGLQITRVAKARGVPEEQVAKLVTSNTEGRALGIVGEPRVNVLALNLALDNELR